jgi:hypothetical protein
MKTDVRNTVWAILGTLSAASLLIVGAVAWADVTRDGVPGTGTMDSEKRCHVVTSDCQPGYNDCILETNNCLIGGQTVAYDHATKVSRESYGYCEPWTGATCYYFSTASVVCMTVGVYETTLGNLCFQQKCTYNWYISQACIPELPGS